MPDGKSGAGRFFPALGDFPMFLPAMALVPAKRGRRIVFLWKGGITMISEEEKLAVVKMFCAYCRKTLRNARTDIIRKQAREARWETVFSDMHESELNRLASPDDLISEEVVFEVVGREVVVMDTVLADAIHGLSKGDQAIVLLYYFAEWTDRRIAEELGCPRSTVQFRRSKALLALRARLEEVIGDDEL